ncbi:MAG: agmatinase family protein [Phycisphaerales bacterium]|nr:agmatinase family protein [Phycisphaerales bacterium]
MFNPDAAAVPGAGVFGLPFTREQSRIVLFAAPYDATTSYRPGTRLGPEAIVQASQQVDLFDGRYGAVYEQGIWMDTESAGVREIAGLSERAARLARPLIDRGGAGEGDRAVLDKIDATGQRVREIIREHTLGVLKEGKLPGLVGGEHAVSMGAIEAVASQGKVGILQIDAHMDLRDAFEGFAWSHASIMHNVLSRVPNVEMLVQVGLRDFGSGEIAFAKSQGSRVRPHFEQDWQDRLADGVKLRELCERSIEPLPDRVYVSFDIDGLDPAMCPHTGTPVPGGLSFHQAMMLLDVLRGSGRRIAGFDLVEVAPGSDEEEPEWDANVGARVLYKLCGVAGVGGEGDAETRRDAVRG